MKRILFALTLLILASAALPRAQAADVSFDFFYNNVSGGSWIEVADYGYCWQPDVVVTNSRWRPYTDGYWAYTDLGWTWVSYEDFGWATYHYGRWVRLADQGWVWAPGRDQDLEWGPAWVSWRTGGDHIGWAPLPPEVTISGRAITGHVDAEFDIGPGYYNFVEVRYIGEPVLRERIIDVSQNVTYVQQTVNVTNITYKDNRVYNYGPDINVINARATRPIQRLKLETQVNVDVNMAAKSGALMKVQGDRLVVGAPMRITKSAQLPPPPRLKAKVQKANIDKGWSGVADPNVKTQLQQKMKTEDPSKAQLTAGAAATGQTAPAASPLGSAPGPIASPTGSPVAAGKGRKGKRGETAQPMASEPPAGATSQGETSSAAGPMGREGKGAKRSGKKGQLETTPEGSSAAATDSNLIEGRKKGSGKKAKTEPNAEPNASGMPRATDSSEAKPMGMEPGKGKRGKMKTAPTDSATEAPAGAGESSRNSSQSNVDKSTSAAEGTTQPGGRGQGKKAGRVEPAGTQAPAGGASELQGQSGGGKHKGRAQTLEPSDTQPDAPASGEPRGKGKGKAKKAEEAPTSAPTP